MSFIAPTDISIPKQYLYSNHKKNSRLSRYFALLVAVSSVAMFLTIVTHMKTKKTLPEDTYDPGASSIKEHHISIGAQPLLMAAPLDTFTSTNCLLRPKSGVIRIPAVRGGLISQRMRIIQDIVVAHELGMAVELPKIIRTRVACGYQESCSNNFEPFVSFETVFDYTNTVKRLQKLNICVVNTNMSASSIPVVSGKEHSTIARKCRFVSVC